MNILYKNMPIQNTIDDEYIIEGIASTDDVDRQNDLITKEAFEKMYGELRDDVPMRYQHQQESVIGVFKRKDIHLKNRGLFVRGSLIKDIPKAMEVWALVKAKVIKSMSIGFVAKQVHYRGDGVREIRDMELLEISLTDIPANENAVVTHFKTIGMNEMGSWDKRELEKELLHRGFSKRLSMKMISKLKDGDDLESGSHREKWILKMNKIVEDLRWIELNNR